MEAERDPCKIKIREWTRGVDPGGAGGQSKILRWQTYRFAPPPPRQLENSIICNARIGLKSIARHYKTIKFDLQILLNIHNYCVHSPPPPPTKIRMRNSRTPSYGIRS